MSNFAFRKKIKHNRSSSNEIQNLQQFDPSFEPKYDENGNIVNHPVFEILDNYYNIRNNQNKIKYFKVIAAAIFLEYRRLYPGLDIIIKFREKGERSVQKNTDKSLGKSDINSISDWKDDIKKDILGMKIVFNGLPDELPFNYSEETEEIMRLNEQRLDNLVFSNKLSKWIQGYSDELLDEETYYNYKIELLSRLKECSYDTFTDNPEAKNPFSHLLTQTIIEKKAKENEGFSFEVKKSQLNDLDDLRSELISRLNEKLENAIIDYTLPNVLNTELIRTELGIDSYRNDSSRKDNGWIRKSTGYVALYYSLIGSLIEIEYPQPYDENQTKKEKLEIEFQANSERTHKIDKKDHNEIPGKKVDILEEFFELKDSNDPHGLKYYIDILDKIQATAVYSRKPEYKTPKKIALSALDHIKLKNTPEDNRALIAFANYVSPWLYTTHSAHNKAIPTVLIEKKKLSENFADVLRKNDGISILAHMLIERVEELEKELDKYSLKSSDDTDNSYNIINIGKFIDKCNTADLQK